MEVSAFDLAQRFVGMKETPGTTSNPAILGMLRLDGTWPKDDAVAWCSAFCNYIAWLLRLPRSKNLAARSWLFVGKPITPQEAKAGYDVVILKRGGNDAGPEVVHADGTYPPGHVGFFAQYDDFNKRVQILAGNQSDSVALAIYPLSQVLGIRRLT